MSKYDGQCRELDDAEVEKKLKEGIPFAIRCKVEDRSEITFCDLIRGEISFSPEVIGDFIIIKSDGTPSYNFAVVVDDSDMKITHVLRGEDHITNTARQILLFENLGLKLPFFAHLSMILGGDGSKLSKRHGATTVSQFREEGYLAEAMSNYLSILSWSPGDEEEIFSIRDIPYKFKILSISKSPAVFDMDKLKWINGIYIRRKTSGELSVLCAPYLIKDKIINTKDMENKWKSFDNSADMDFNEEQSKELIGFIGENLKEQKIKGRFLYMPIRVSLTGKTHGPELQKVISMLGLENCIKRVKQTLEYIKSNNL